MADLKNIVFKRVEGIDYSEIRDDLKMFNIFFSIDGERTVNAISQDHSYDSDYLFSAIDKMEKMGLVVPVDGAGIQSAETAYGASFASLPEEFLTGIEPVDQQHQRLVDMVAQLEDVRKTAYPNKDQKHEAVGGIVSEMIDYTIRHFAFEESLMQDAQYKFYSAHKRIHELLIKRAGEYKERWVSGEDIADELYDVLKRWLFNHILNDDKAYASAVKWNMGVLDSKDSGWLNHLLQRIFKKDD